MHERMSIQTARWTLLLVDDEPTILITLERILRRTFVNAHILTATEGATALRMLAEEEIDLVISDFQMPGMDGATLLAHAARTSPLTMRMLLTGRTDAEVATRSVNEGRIHAFHLKPIGIDALVEAVERLLAEGNATKLRQRAFARSLGSTRPHGTAPPFTGKPGDE